MSLQYAGVGQVTLQYSRIRGIMLTAKAVPRKGQGRKTKSYKQAVILLSALFEFLSLFAMLPSARARPNHSRLLANKPVWQQK